MSVSRQDAFTLTEISDFGGSNSNVELPTIQRGFVWKPSQIENLWNSLFRGFPVGSFVFAEKLADQESQAFLQLLDGQQRATAICLGFGKSTFRNSEEKIKIFVDLGIEDQLEKNKDQFLFRVITKSHPWGYRKQDNSKTLESIDIKKAYELYGVKNHLEENDLNKFFPYDASIPVPLAMLMNASSIDDFKIKLKEWIPLTKIKEKWEKRQSAEIEKNKKIIQNDKEHPKFEETVLSGLEKVFLQKEILLNKSTPTKIPAIYLSSAINHESIPATGLNEDLQSLQPDGSGELVDEDEIDEIEELFIRLNAGGTPLRGEELNYSILKAHINNDLQNLIEINCKALFNPARFVTIAYRLFQHKSNEDALSKHNSPNEGVLFQHNKSDGDRATSMRIKPKQFQKQMLKEKKGFSEFLEGLIRGSFENEMTLLEYVKNLLICGEQTPFGLPYIVASKLSDEAPEVMFMLLYRLLIRNDRFDAGSALHKKMLGVITIFVWLGKDSKRRNYSRLFNNIWPGVKNIDNENDFWSSAIVERAMIDQVLMPIPDWKKLSSNMLIANKTTKRSLSKFSSNDEERDFINKTFYQRDLILYAQRHFLRNAFGEDDFSLDDTNIPFDWDHISPNRLLRRRNIKPLARELYATIGNFRAWPFSLNRMDHDDLPYVKLDPLNKIHYPINEDKIKERLSDWQDSCKSEIKLKDLSSKLFEWSACKSSEGWLDLKSDDLGENWDAVCRAILERNKSIISGWFTDLNVYELKPKEGVEIASFQSSLEQIINKSKWRSKDEKIKGLFGYTQAKDLIGSDVYYWSTECRFQSPEKSIYIYIWVDINEGFEALESGNIVFGVAERQSEKGVGTFIDGMIIPEIKQKVYQKETYNGYCYLIKPANFTLLHFGYSATISLFGEFGEWLKFSGISNVNENEISYLCDHFKKSIKTSPLTEIDSLNT